MRHAFIMFAIGCASPALAASESATPDLLATVATRSDNAMRMTVPVTIEGRGPYQFVVDTGSDRTVVSRELAASLNLAVGETVTMHSMTGVAPANTVSVPSLTVAGQTTRDINAPALQQDYLGGHGLLGIDTLKGRRVVMDFAKRTLSVLRAGEKEAYDPDTIVVTARSKFGQLVLVDADVDGTPITVIIDSGAQNTIGNAPLRAQSQDAIFQNRTDRRDRRAARRRICRGRPYSDCRHPCRKRRYRFCRCASVQTLWLAQQTRHAARHGHAARV
jgi:hypothetical protein